MRPKNPSEARQICISLLEGCRCRAEACILYPFLGNGDFSICAKLFEEDSNKQKLFYDTSTLLIRKMENSILDTEITSAKTFTQIGNVAK